MKRQCIRSLSALAFWAVASVCALQAQETINYASVSGRVSDAQGGAVQGAQVSARQTETNVTAETVTDSEGRFRFPYLKVGPYEVKVHAQGFADSSRKLSLTVGSAFDLTITLGVAGVDTSVTVTGEAPILETARSQIAGTVPQGEVQSSADERPQLPRSGAAHPGRVADQHRQHAAVRRNVGGARPGHFDRQPAQPLEQLHRRRAVGER